MASIGSPGQRVKTRYRQALALLLAALAIASSTTMYLAYFAGRFTLDDDYVWLYMTSVRIAEPDCTYKLLDVVDSAL
jgi:hypothetical protein